MSRYVRVPAPVASLDAVAEALTAMGLAFDRNPRGVMLEGGLECPGEPVTIRLAAGTADAVEDFGFVLDAGHVMLVCGDIDRDLLSRGVLAEVTRRCVEVAVADVPGVTVVGVSAGSGRGSGSGGTSSGE
ncbi:MAG: hypothetical protein AAF721_27080 [Myxococcota bacterium]